MVDKNMIDNIDLKFVRQDPYTSGGLDTMQGPIIIRAGIILRPFQSKPPSQVT